MNHKIYSIIIARPVTSIYVLDVFQKADLKAWQFKNETLNDMSIHEGALMLLNISYHG